MGSVAVVDYGSGNLRSVSRALELVAGADYQVTVTGRGEDILSADRVVFPGQGAIGQCMQTLIQKDFPALLRECVRRKPFLGICVGLQTLMDYSEEDGGTEGLGIIPGEVLKFQTNAKDENGNTYKIPHMGWNRVRQVRDHPLWKNIKSSTHFYFVHSYYVRPEDSENCVGETDYLVDFASAVAKDNLFATQFHPEKSQQAGLTLLRNFLNWKP